MKWSPLAVLAMTAPLASAQLPFWQLDDPSQLAFTDANGVHYQVKSFVESSKGSTLSAALDSWLATGPYGGEASSIAASPLNPGVVLCGLAPTPSADGQVYRSVDGGLTWAPASLIGVDVHAVEFATDGTAYAGTTDGLFKSTDGGVTWTALALGIGSDQKVIAITTDASNPSVVWIGIDSTFTSQQATVLRTADAGNTWSDHTPVGAAGSPCHGIALDPSQPSVAFTAFGSLLGTGSVWRTNDTGSTWGNISAGLPQAPLTDVSLVAGKLLVAGGSLFGPVVFGLYQSLDFGITWTPLHDSSWPTKIISDVEVDPASPATIFVSSLESGVFRSTDGGATWAFGVGATADLAINEVSVSPAGTGEVFAASPTLAVFRSPAGVLFAPSATGISSLSTTAVAVHPHDDQTLAVAFSGLNSGGIFTSQDAGASWNLESAPATRYSDVGYDATGKLFALSAGPTTIAPEGMWRRDGGVWSSIGPDQGPDFESDLAAFDIDEGDPNRILVCGTDTMVLGEKSSIFVTTDGGASWRRSYAGSAAESVTDVRLLGSGPAATAVAALTSSLPPIFGSGGALRSVNAGELFVDSSMGLGSSAQGYGLATDPNDAQTVYFADGGSQAKGLFVSHDQGASWQATGADSSLKDVVVDPLHPGVIYASHSLSAFSFDPDMQKSVDGGATLQSFEAGLPAVLSVNDLALRPGACNTLLAATSSGLYSRVVSCRLEADVDTISLSTGGTQAFTVSGGAAHQGELYWLLGSASGTTPGVLVDGQVLPLNPDAWTVTTLAIANGPILPGSLGTLNASGQATSAALVVPPASDPALLGLVLHHAAVFISSSSGSAQVVLTSNPVEVTLAP